MFGVFFTIPIINLEKTINMGIIKGDIAFLIFHLFHLTHTKVMLW